jgi:hypothetical protein
MTTSARTTPSMTGTMAISKALATQDHFTHPSVTACRFSPSCPSSYNADTSWEWLALFLNLLIDAIARFSNWVLDLVLCKQSSQLCASLTRNTRACSKRNRKVAFKPCMGREVG